MTQKKIPTIKVKIASKPNMVRRGLSCWVKRKVRQSLKRNT